MSYERIYKMSSFTLCINVYIINFSEIDLSQLLYSFWRVGIIMSKLKINYALIKYI